MRKMVTTKVILVIIFSVIILVLVLIFIPETIKEGIGWVKDSLEKLTNAISDFLP